MPWFLFSSKYMLLLCIFLLCIACVFGELSSWSGSVSTFLFCFVEQNKKERKKVREVGILKKDPDQLKKQIENLEMMSKSCFILYWKSCNLISSILLIIIMTKCLLSVELLIDYLIGHLVVVVVWMNLLFCVIVRTNL